MADKYVNSTDLGYYHGRIKTIFADKTDLQALDAKVDEIIEEGGEPNTIETVKVNGTALTPDANKAVNVETPTVAIASDGEATIAASASDYIVFAPQSNGNLGVASAYDGSEQYENTLATTAYVDQNGGKIDTIAVNNVDQTITNKRVNLAVPTKVSDITNDSGFQNATEVQALIDASIADITGIDFQIVTELPATGEHGVIYLVPKTGSSGDIYDEYIWVTPTGGTAHFEKIGTTEIDLSDYWTKTELVAMTTAEIDALFA